MKKVIFAVAAGCVVFGVIVLFLEPAQYFFGDSIAVLWGRPHSFGSLLKDFVRLDGGHWYRPLSNSLPPFVLFPFFGMQFKPYHLVAIALHCLFCIGLFEIFRRLLRDSLAAFVSTAFFAFHPIQFYATYDIAFYQEPIMAALTIASLILFCRYIERPRVPVLLVGLFTFLGALCAKETSVVMPALLILAFRGRRDIYGLPSARNALVSAAGIAGFFTLLYSRVISASFLYQPTYRPRIELHAVGDAVRGLLWSFGIPAGVETQAWQYPFGIELGLWFLFVVIVALAVARPDSGVWRGLVWFFVAAGPAFFTRHLLPHHLYLGVAGVAYGVGQAVAWIRAREFHRAVPARASYALACGAVALIFCAGYLDARSDSAHSWVGESSRRIQDTGDFLRSARVDLSKSQGILAVIGDAQYLRFDWMGGAFFNMLGGDELEVRLADWQPEHIPEGFYALKYDSKGLRKITDVETLHTNALTAPEAPLVVSFQLTAARVYAGDSYCLNVPRFAGQTIDVKYHYNQRPASVAYSFAHLNSKGTACVDVAASVPWGKVDVVGVRPSGSLRWSSASAEIEVLPAFSW